MGICLIGMERGLGLGIGGKGDFFEGWGEILLFWGGGIFWDGKKGGYLAVCVGVNM